MTRGSFRVAGTLLLTLQALGCARTVLSTPGDPCLDEGAGCEPEQGSGTDGPLADDQPDPVDDAPDPVDDAPDAWRIELDYLPVDGLSPFRVIDMVIGPGADLWLLGEFDDMSGGHLFVERLAPDGSRRWAEPWTSDLSAQRIGVGPEVLPTGRLVVDSRGHATVATVVPAASAQAPSFVTLEQLSPEGVSVWTAQQEAHVLAGMMVDDADRVYASLQLTSGESGHPLLGMLRFQTDGALDVSTPLATGELNAPVSLVFGGDGQREDGADVVFVTGAIGQIFGAAKQAFIGRYALHDGSSTWPPGPVASGPRDYTGVVAAVPDGEGGIVAVVANDIPSGVFDLQTGPSTRELRRIDEAGNVRWSTALRTADGATRTEGFAEWNVLAAADGVGGTAVAYAVTRDSTQPAPFGLVDVLIDRLDASGAFVWSQPHVIESDGASLPRGLGFGPDGGLYVATAPADPTVRMASALERLSAQQVAP